MSLNVATGQLSTGTGAAGTTVSITSLSFDPTAAGVKSVLLLWWNGRTDTTNTAGRRTHQFGFGAAVDATHRAYATTLAQDTPTTMVTNRVQDTAQCIGITTTSDTIDGLMDFDAWLSNGFRLIVDDAFTASYTIQWMVISGTEVLNATVSSFAKATTTGNQDVNVGFVPNFLMMWQNSQSAANGTVGVNAKFSLGVAKDSTNQYVLGMASLDAAATSKSLSYVRKGDITVIWNNAVTALTDRATFSQFQSSPSSGFQINWVSTVGLTEPMLYLAIQFSDPSQFDVGDLTTQTDTVTAITEGSLSTTSPIGGFVASAARAQDSADTPSNHFFASLGAFDSASSRLSLAAMDQNNAATAVVGTAVYFDEVYINMPTTAGSVQGLMDVTGLSANTLTFLMDDADPSGVFAWYFAIGLNQASGTLNSTLGALTASGTGTSENHGDLTKTLGALIASATATNEDHGTLTKALGALTSSAAGTVSISGTAGKTLGALTASAAGTVEDHATVNSILGTLTGSGSGTVEDHGALDGTLGALTVTAAGAVAITGALDKTLDPLTLAADGTFGSPVTGSGSSVLGDLAAVAAGTVEDHGTVDTTLGALTASSTATSENHGDLAKTLGTMTASAAGIVPVTGSGSSVLGDLAAVAAGTVEDHGTLGSTLGALVLAAEGTTGGSIAGAVSITLGTMTAAADGAVAITGTASITLGALTVVVPVLKLVGSASHRSAGDGSSSISHIEGRPGIRSYSGRTS